MIWFRFLLRAIVTNAESGWPRGSKSARENSSSAPLGLPHSSFPPTACAMGCILAKPMTSVPLRPREFVSHAHSFDPLFEIEPTLLSSPTSLLSIECKHGRSDGIGSSKIYEAHIRNTLVNRRADRLGSGSERYRTHRCPGFSHH